MACWSYYNKTLWLQATVDPILHRLRCDNEDRPSGPPSVGDFFVGGTMPKTWLHDFPGLIHLPYVV